MTLLSLLKMLVKDQWVPTSCSKSSTAFLSGMLGIAPLTRTHNDAAAAAERQKGKSICMNNSGSSSLPLAPRLSQRIIIKFIGPALTFR